MQDSTPQQQKHSLLFCDRGVSLCNPGLLAGEFNVQRIKSVWSLQMDQIPANPGHLEGTQAEGEWIPQDSQGPTNSPTTSRGCNLPGGRLIWCTQPSRFQLSLSRFPKLCPPSHPSDYLLKMRTVLSPLPLVGDPLASLWEKQRV